MFTATTLYRICITLVGAVSVRGKCWITPNENGRVVIPKGTKTIPPRAFRACGALNEVFIPPSVLRIGGGGGNIGSGVFYDAVNLKRVFFKKGSGLEGIGNWAFAGTSSLKVITFPANLKVIGSNAFSGSGLEKIIFEEGSTIEVIGYGAFRGNGNLKTINIPPGVVIEEFAFENTGCPEDIFTPGVTIVNCRILAETKGLHGNEIVSSE